MIKVALRGLAGRKLRAVLTAIAIVLGVAMISGTYILTDTIDRAFTTLFTESYAGTDAVVTGRGSTSRSTARRRRTRPSTRRCSTRCAASTVSRSPPARCSTSATRRSSRPRGKPSAPRVHRPSDSASTRLQRSTSSIRSTSSRAVGPRRPTRSSSTSARRTTRATRSATTVEISTLQPKRSFELVGVAQYGSLDSLGNASFAVFTIPAAQELLDREGQYDAISVAANEGITEDELVAAIEPVLPDNAKVVSATAEAEEQVDEVNEFTAIFRYFLLVFAGIALFVGAFVIFNTFSITVAQRTREFATLRTIGASRRQILGSVILESLVIGLLASLVGLGLGVVLAEGIEGLFRALGVELPTADRVFALRTVIVALAVGVGITLVAGLFPAIQATRVPPIAAVREVRRFRSPGSRRSCPGSPGSSSSARSSSWPARCSPTSSGPADRLLSIAAGVLLLFLGVAMLSSHVVRPLAAISSPIGRWAAFAFTVLFWPFLLLPYWLLRYGAWGPGSACAPRRRLRRRRAAQSAAPAVVLVMWLRRAVTSWEPEWPMEFPSVVPDRVAARTGGENARRNPAERRRPRLR